MSEKLGTAEWMAPADAAAEFAYTAGDFWIGRDPVSGASLGYDDDRHVCLVSGGRGGKGATCIANNLALWPGSIVVVDPKGENATVVARRRGPGSQSTAGRLEGSGILTHPSEACDGMGQKVFVLDPYGAARGCEAFRASYNPLDLIGEHNPESTETADGIAEALVVDSGSDHVHWDQHARNLISALILHVASSPDFEGRRNLISVRDLIMRGDVGGVAELTRIGTKNVPSAHQVLWDMLSANPAFGGAVSSAGALFAHMQKKGGEEFSGVMSFAARNTDFLKHQDMANVLSSSSFQLSDLKADPKGISLFISLPQRHMPSHFRWLRLLITLTRWELERNPAPPQSGHRVLLCLDEFASLERMRVIENALDQSAGFGLKMLFVVQSLEQLKSTYPDRWETFLAQSGLQLYFNNNDYFTRDYVCRSLGEREVVRETASRSSSKTRTQSSSAGEGASESESVARAERRSASTTLGSARGSLWRPQTLVAEAISNSLGGNRQKHHSTGDDTTEGRQKSRNTFHSSTESTSESAQHGVQDHIFKRALITPDEFSKVFARIDNKAHPLFPGLGLALVSGKAPFAFLKTLYFEDAMFHRKYSKHPDHPFFPFLTDPQHIWRIRIPKKLLQHGFTAKPLLEIGSDFQRGESLFALARKDNEQFRVAAPFSGRVKHIADVESHELDGSTLTIVADRPMSDAETASLEQSLFSSAVRLVEREEAERRAQAERDKLQQEEERQRRADDDARARRQQETEEEERRTTFRRWAGGAAVAAVLLIVWIISIPRPPSVKWRFDGWSYGTPYNENAGYPDYLPDPTSPFDLDIRKKFINKSRISVDLWGIRRRVGSTPQQWKTAILVVSGFDDRMECRMYDIAAKRHNVGRCFRGGEDIGLVLLRDHPTVYEIDNSESRGYYEGMLR